MRNKRLVLVAPIAVLSLALAGCSSADNTQSSGDAADYVVKVLNTEPANGLIPSNTAENAGGRAVDGVFSRLVYYTPKGETEYEDAESIETEDNQNFTVKLKKDLKFSDGTPVTAESYVKAWKWGALASNGQLCADFFSSIEGFDTESDSELNLQVVDDHTFTIKLTQPDYGFVKSLGYTAFAPLPESFYKDPEAFGENPVGSGPYVMKNWEHNKKIELRVNKEYNGPRKAHNGGLDLVVYQSTDAAYNDLLSNNLDVLDSVPASQLASFKTDLGDRALVVPTAGIYSFVVPGYLEHFGWDEEGQLRRQALSMAVDRDLIVKNIFQSLRKPATDFTAPVIPGYDPKLEGSEVLKYDPKKAVELWEKANAISPWSGSFELAYNADGGHKEWADAVCNSIKNTLKIDAKGKPYAQFAELRKDAVEKKLTSAVRGGWQADFPWPSNFIDPMYVTGAGSNDAGYSNPEVDALSKKMAVATSDEGVFEEVHKIEQILFRDLPGIPLWYPTVAAGYSENVKNVNVAWNSEIALYLIEKK